MIDPNFRRAVAFVGVVALMGCGGSGNTGTGGGAGSAAGGRGGDTGSGGASSGSAGSTGSAGTTGTAGGGATGTAGGAGGTAGGAGGTAGGAGGTAGGMAGRGGAGGTAGGTAGRGGTGGTAGMAGRGGAGGTAGGMAGRGGAGGTAGACTGTGVPPLKLTRIAGGLTLPVFATQPAGETRLFIVEQVGRIKVFRDNQLLAQPFLAVESSVFGASGDGAEKGFLGLAFHPSYSSNGRFFVFYNRTASDPYSTGSEGDIVVAEGKRSTGSADVAAAGLTPLFVIPQRRLGHTGGMLAFGPDGMLYIGNGDAVDAASSADPTSKYGKILRVNVGSAAPATPNLDPAVVHYGLRNPWRFSFDRSTGDMLIGDVGESIREEVDFVAAGRTGLNFGWPTMEGTACATTGCSMTGLTLPIYDYGRDQGRAIVGGYVYRGNAAPCLRGRYFFGDYGDSKIYTFALSNGQATGFVDLTALLNVSATPVDGVSSFGEDSAGELYLVSIANGVVYRIDPA